MKSRFTPGNTVPCFEAPRTSLTEAAAAYRILSERPPRSAAEAREFARAMNEANSRASRSTAQAVAARLAELDHLATEPRRRRPAPGSTRAAAPRLSLHAIYAARNARHTVAR